MKQQQELLQQQIAMLQQQIAQIQQQQAEKALEQQQKAEAATDIKKEEGVNKPTDTNAIDIYV